MGVIEISEFTKKVLKQIHSIPAGKVATYKQIAELAGKPQGSRGVAWILAVGLGQISMEEARSETEIKAQSADLQPLVKYSGTFFYRMETKVVRVSSPPARKTKIRYLVLPSGTSAWNPVLRIRPSGKHA